MSEKTIWTVIIKSNSLEELSSVSFRDPSSAVEYVLAELAEEFDYEGEYDDVKAELEEQMYYEGATATYWIEESKLF